MSKKNPFDEARRYVENAHTTLDENGKLDEEYCHYEDKKYVRVAGRYLWHSILIALDAVFHVRKDRRTRVDIEAYEEAVAKRDRKLLGMLKDSYNVTHLSMGYDGVQSKQICDAGFRLANQIIDRCEKMAAVA